MAAAMGAESVFGVVRLSYREQKVVVVGAAGWGALTKDKQFTPAPGIFHLNAFVRGQALTLTSQREEKGKREKNISAIFTCFSTALLRSEKT